MKTGGGADVLEKNWPHGAQRENNVTSMLETFAVKVSKSPHTPNHPTVRIARRKRPKHGNVVTEKSLLSIQL